MTDAPRRPRPAERDGHGTDDEGAPVPDPAADEVRALEIALGIDWKLGQQDKTTAAVLWVVVLGIALFGLPYVAMGLLRLPSFLETANHESALLVLTAYAFGLLFLGAANGMRVYLSGGRAGRWGKFVASLAKPHGAVEVELTGPCEVLPGIRPRLQRRALLLALPGRLLIVSREWNAWLVVLLIAPGLTLVVMGMIHGLGDAGAALMWVFLAFWMALRTLCRITRVHTIHAVDLGEPTTDSAGAVVLPVEFGGLAPEVRLTHPRRGWFDNPPPKRAEDLDPMDPARRLLDRVLATSSAPASDPRVQQLEARSEE